jgi:hypothetical protein
MKEDKVEVEASFLGQFVRVVPQVVCRNLLLIVICNATNIRLSASQLTI